MRMFGIAATMLAAWVVVAGQVQAEDFPSHLKSCKKAATYEQVGAWQTVPVASGNGGGRVQIVSRNYECINKQSRIREQFAVVGMKDSGGKLIVPHGYNWIVPFSTTGALVSGKTGTRTYIAGKGESKDNFDFQDVKMLRPNDGCPPSAIDTSPSNVSTVMGELFYGVGGGKSHVTLFTPQGIARKLEYMGGKDIKPSVRRVGDVLVARWRDEQGQLRTGILDLNGRQIAPVLANSSLWVTPKSGINTTSVDGCKVGSLDLFIEGPSLDYDPAKIIYGRLLMPVGRYGEPMTLPKGAIGMFPGYARQNTSPFTDSVSNTAVTWAVVFATDKSFEFTLTIGTPSEALIAAETAPRYNSIGRSGAFGGTISVRSVSDGKWRTFRSDTLIAVGQPDADLKPAFDSAMAILGAEESRRVQAQQAVWAEEDARRAEARRQNREKARAAGWFCVYRVDSEDSRAIVEEQLLACGPGAFPGLVELARAKGIPESTIQKAADDAWERRRAQLQGLAEAEEKARIRRRDTANKSASAGYVPGQWESAIRNAGNVAVDHINTSADNWLQQRRDQYTADWQRSQRAY